MPLKVNRPSEVRQTPLHEVTMHAQYRDSTRINGIEAGKALLIQRTLVQLLVLYFPKQFLVVIRSQNLQWQK